MNTLGLVTRAVRRRSRGVALSGAALLASCGPPQRGRCALDAEDFEFRITMDPIAAARAGADHLHVVGRSTRRRAQLDRERRGADLRDEPGPA